MTKMAFIVATAAAALMTAPLIGGVIPANAQGLKVAQGADIEVGRDRHDRDRYGRDYRDHGTTVGIGPGGVTIGPRHHCRMVTTTVQRDDGRSITRRERRCD